MKYNKAFTLLEILLVVAVISILAGIVILAINPSRQLAVTRNSQRFMDVNNIHKAVYQYAIDKGSLPATIGSTPIEICRSGASDCTGLVDLSGLTNDSTYLVSIPIDPRVSSPNGTGYVIYQTSFGRPVVSSSLAELDQQISTINPSVGVTTSVDLTSLAIGGSVANYSFTGGTYNYNGVVASSTAASITVTPVGLGVITVDGSVVNSGEASGSINLTAGIEKSIIVTTTEAGKLAKTYTIKVTRLVIGMNYQGGKIAYIDGTGLHGLIAAPSDQSASAQWGCVGIYISGADGIIIGSGSQNTIDINNGCNTAGISARIAGDLSLGGYTDWYLPSKDELNQLYLNKVAIGNFVNGLYWSSSEATAGSAYCQFFVVGSTAANLKSTNYNVRAVRSF